MIYKISFVTAFILFNFVVKNPTDCVEIEISKTLSDEFIWTIFSQQCLWKAGRNFHKNSQLKNLINVNSFNRRNFTLVSKYIDKAKSLPKNFDSAIKWPKCESIKSVHDQGNCASSYAIVPASVFTDRLCIQKNIIRPSSSDQLLSCCIKCGGGCFGGLVDKSFSYMNNVGLVTGGHYKSKFGCRPYRIDSCKTLDNLPACDNIRSLNPTCYGLKCSNKNYKNVTFDKDKIKMKDVYAVPNSINMIKTEIMINGSVSATMTIYEDFFNYKSGVYYHTVGEMVGEHQVKIIGWGETFFLQTYWLAVNSWGTKWGENGLFKIVLGVNDCNIESHVLSGSFL